MLDAALRFKYVTIAATAGLFALSIVGMGFVQQEFFPFSDRSEIFVNLTLPQSASITANRKDRHASKPFSRLTPISNTGASMSARARCASICPSISNWPTTSSPRLWWSPRVTERPGVQARLEKALAAASMMCWSGSARLNLGPRWAGRSSSGSAAMIHPDPRIGPRFAQLIGANPQRREHQL